jgi:hypothetical protein
MAYASKAGRARTSARNPQAHAICDRCGERLNHVDLSWQFDWAGAGLINKRLLVCNHCNDTPQQQLRSIVLPADPPVIMNARPEYFIEATIDYRTTQGNTVNAKTGIPVPGGDTRVTETNQPRTTQQTGFANGSRNGLPGTDQNAVTFRIVTNAYNNGSGLIRLVLDTTNGMITGQQIIVGGINIANGNWTVTVIDATQIDLQGSTFSGSYTPGGYVINNPSLPYDNIAVPQTGENALDYRDVTAVANNGSGLIRLTLNTANGLITSQRVTVGNVGGVSAANGNWAITVINATQIDLQGSTFSGSYTSGGYVINNLSVS